MEKKVPERKVTLKDDDIIYVYDKRINKCIREDTVQAACNQDFQTDRKRVTEGDEDVSGTPEA